MGVTAMKSESSGATVLKFTGPQRKTMSHVETLGPSKEELLSWKVPPFQRPLRVNDKVRRVADVIKTDGGVIPGIITLGVLRNDKKTTWLLDGQHRREGAVLSGLSQFYVDVRICEFDMMAEMGQEFVDLNSHLVTMRPDDVLRGLEASSPALSKIRRECPFVGYDQIRRGPANPMLSMSAALRCWNASAQEVPAPTGGGAARIAGDLTMEEADGLIVFLLLCDRAWARDPEFAVLWKNLNLALTMWLYRRTVVTAHSAKTARLSKDLFVKCMMALSANPDYLDYMVGRNLTERDRSPTYDRLKRIFARRIEQETGKKPMLPAPPWAAHGYTPRTKIVGAG
jgi:hypothetical protein